MARKKEGLTRFNRIVYFDEPSATDLVYLENKGQILKEIGSSEIKQTDVQTNAKAEVGTAFNFLSWFKTKMNIDAGVTL